MKQDKIAVLFRDFARAEEINRQNLQKILRDNQDTEYGRKMAFAQIEDERAYKEQVPLTIYEDYDGLCEPMRYTAYPIGCRLATSGSTGAQKVFALTKEALNRYGSYIYEMAYHHYGGRQGTHLHTSVFRLQEQGEKLLSAAYHSWLKAEGVLDPEAYVGGEKLLFAKDVTDVFYVKTWLLLCCPSLVSIQSIFLYDVLLIMQYLEQNWRSVLADMRTCLKEGIGLQVRQELLSCLPEESVLTQVEKVLEEGFDTPILPRLFKGLRFISGIGGKSMEFQTKALERYSGDVPISYFAYASSECMMGIAPYPGRAVYALLPYSAYYEFLGENEELTRMSDLVAGACYEPVITTFSGLYRYRTGDIIRVCGYEGQTPVFEIEGRKQCMNIAGEKLDERLVQTAVADWAKQIKITLSDYAVGVEQTVPGRYLAFVETASEHPDADVLDRILQQMSEDYCDIRTLGMLRQLRVIVCPTGHIAQAAAGEGHRKHHTFLKEEQTERLLHNDEREQ